MFGFLERFDDWLESQTKNSVQASAKPGQDARDASNKYEEEREKASMRRLIVKNLAKAGAPEYEAAQRKEESDWVARFDFSCERFGSILVIRIEGHAYALNIAFLRKMTFSPGNAYSNDGGVVLYNDISWKYQDGLDIEYWSYGSFYNRSIPEMPEPFRAAKFNLEGLEFEFLCPHTLGGKVNTQLIEAISS